MTGGEWLVMLIILSVIGWLIPESIPIIVIGYFIAMISGD